MWALDPLVALSGHGLRGHPKGDSQITFVFWEFSVASVWSLTSVVVENAFNGFPKVISFS